MGILPSTLAFFTNPRGLTTGPTKKAICIDLSLVKQQTLINTMDTAVDAAVIRGLRKWLKVRLPTQEQVLPALQALLHVLVLAFD